MKMFRLSLIVALLLMVCAGVCVDADAASRVGQILTVSSGAPQGHTHVVTSAAKVYRIGVRSNEALAWAALIDTSAMGADSLAGYMSKIGSGAKVMIDIGATTAGDWVNVDLSSNPLVFNAGIFLMTGVTLSDGTPGQEAVLEPATIIFQYGSK